MGAWIEISRSWYVLRDARVAPFMGAWIEIVVVRGLKLDNTVAPFMGAWIEIMINMIIPGLRPT